MKHTRWLILIVLTINSEGGSSQNEYFSGNPKWGMNEQHQWSAFDDPWGKKTTLYVDGDTVLNNEVYVKIYEVGIQYWGLNTSNYSEIPYSNPSVVACLRSEGMKMYKWDEYQNEEELLYDFDVEEGGQFNYSPNLTDATDPTLFVDSISYITLGGTERKVIHIEGWENEGGDFIEGVGHRRGLWHPLGPQLDFEWYFVCYTLNGESYFIDMYEAPWLMPSTQQCEFVVGLEEISERNINLYPNPANAYVSLVSASQINSIEITDFTGRIVFKLQPNSTYADLDIKILSSGYYFVRVTSDDNRIKTLKLIKE
jgi:hypothetical protein